MTMPTLKEGMISGSSSPLAKIAMNVIIVVTIRPATIEMDRTSRNLTSAMLCPKGLHSRGRGS